MAASVTGKIPLKEKLITYYEQLLEGKDFSEKKNEFWEEFFLLKVNVEYLEQAIEKLSSTKLMEIKKSINTLFIKCCCILQVNDNMIRNINSLQCKIFLSKRIIEMSNVSVLSDLVLAISLIHLHTQYIIKSTLCALVRAIYNRLSMASADISLEVIDVLIGVDRAQCQMRNLIESLRKFLSEDYPISVKNLCLKLILIILTSIDNISQNVMLEYLMINSLFEALVSLLSDADARDHHGYDAAVVLSLLVNYRKHETANLYVIKLSVLDNEIALNGLGHVISTILTEYIKEYTVPVNQPKGFLSYVASWFGNSLTPMEDPPLNVKINDAILLVLYEAIYLNKHFHSVLTHTRSVSSPTTPVSPPAVYKNLPVPGGSMVADGSSLFDVGDVTMATQPMNLLGTLLTFTSILLQNIKGEKTKNSAYLSLVILNCIVENSQISSFLHDPNMTFHIEIHRAPLLHRRVAPDKLLQNTPLACSLLELLVEFIVSHLSKTFHITLYSKCLGIIHRLLCYQKRHKIRLDYNWKELWNALISLLRFLSSSGDHLLPRINIFTPANEVVKIFNLFITYGDTFLPSPTIYDEMYYELIRVQTLFDTLYQQALKHSTPDETYNVAAGELMSSIYNIRSIATHFMPKIDSFCSSKQTDSLSPDQVLEVIRSNYDTLTLKLQDGLDQHDKYNEKPKENSFFTQLVRQVTKEARQSITINSLHQLSVLCELSEGPV